MGLRPVSLARVPAGTMNPSAPGWFFVQVEGRPDPEWIMPAPGLCPRLVLEAFARGRVAFDPLAHRLVLTTIARAA